MDVPVRSVRHGRSRMRHGRPGASLTSQVVLFVAFCPYSCVRYAVCSRAENCCFIVDLTDAQLTQLENGGECEQEHGQFPMVIKEKDNNNIIVVRSGHGIDFFLCGSPFCLVNKTAGRLSKFSSFAATYMKNESFFLQCFSFLKSSSFFVLFWNA